jgi:hypothetical protein
LPLKNFFASNSGRELEKMRFVGFAALVLALLFVV